MGVVRERSRRGIKVCSYVFVRVRADLCASPTICATYEGKKVARSQPGNLSRIGSLLHRRDFCSPPCNHRESVAAAANYVS